jgi:hypothetical protein
MTSSHHGPYVQGYTRDTMAASMGEGASRRLIPNSSLSSDRGLKLDPVKTESLVIADQHAAVNTFPGLAHTARHAMGAGGARRRYPR